MAENNTSKSRMRCCCCCFLLLGAWCDSAHTIHTVCSRKTLNRTRYSRQFLHLPHSHRFPIFRMITRISTLSVLPSMAYWRDAWSSSRPVVMWTSQMQKTCPFCIGRPSTTGWKSFGMLMCFYCRSIHTWRYWAGLVVHRWYSRCVAACIAWRISWSVWMACCIAVCHY